MMKCPHCLKKVILLQSEPNRCPNCGELIDILPDPEWSVHQPKQADPVTFDEKLEDYFWYRDGLRWIDIGLVLSFIMSLCFLPFVLLNPKNFIWDPPAEKLIPFVSPVVFLALLFVRKKIVQQLVSKIASIKEKAKQEIDQTNKSQKTPQKYVLGAASRRQFI